MNINSLYCYYSIHIPPVTLSEKCDKIPLEGCDKMGTPPPLPLPLKGRKSAIFKNNVTLRYLYVFDNENNSF